MKANWPRDTLLPLGIMVVIGGVLAYASGKIFFTATTTAITLFEGLLLVLAVFYGSMYYIFTRRVEVSSEGVVFVERFDRVRSSWNEIKPPDRTALFGFLFQAGPRGFIVTTEQARAILQHPACPRFSLPANLEKSLRPPSSETRA